MFSGRLFRNAFTTIELSAKRGTKHWDIKWSQKRKEKFYKIDLPDFDKIRRDMKLPPEEQESLLKKEGRMPPRHHQDRPILITCTSTIFEAYIPPEGDGLLSNLTKGAKNKLSELEMKRKSFTHLRKIKSFDEDIDVKEFPEQGLNIYQEAMNLLQNYKENEDRLHELVTEKAYPELVVGLKRRTLRWQYMEGIEPPRVVHVRTTEMLSKDNLYAQITVRYHSKQKLALYDQYGRLMYGDAQKPRDVLEFVVFERHLANEYGKWRVHGKIKPDWSVSTEGSDVMKTIMIPYAEEDLKAKELLS